MNNLTVSMNERSSEVTADDVSGLNSYLRSEISAITLLF